MRAHREEAVTDHGHMLALAAASRRVHPAALNHRWDGLRGLRDLKALDDTLDDPTALAAFAARLERLRDRLPNMRPGNCWPVSEAERQDDIAAALATHWREGATGAIEPFALAMPGGIAGPAGVQRQHPSQLLCQGLPHRRAQPPRRSDCMCWAISCATATTSGHPRTGRCLRRRRRTIPTAHSALLPTVIPDWRIRWPISTRHWTGYTHDHPARTLEEAILGVVAAIDKPGSPAGEAVSAFFGILFDHARNSAAPIGNGCWRLRWMTSKWRQTAAAGTGPLRGVQQRADAGGTARFSLSSRFDANRFGAVRVRNASTFPPQPMFVL
ncbi:MAG: hypothetical protein R3F36_00890 [Candidatus Competibacteraceae bacterium]